MRVILGDTWCTVERGDGPKIYTDSLLFAHIRDELKKQGYDVIKKCPAKDGHLIAMPYYVRSRDLKQPGFAITDDLYAVRAAYSDYNKGEVVGLRVTRW